MPPYPPAMSEAAELHDRDFYAWTQAQAALLRAWPEALRPNALDIANLAEEIEDLGKSERRAIESLIGQIVIHLLKLRCHPDQTARRAWQKEVAAFRPRLARLLRDNPSLRAARAEIAAEVWAPVARQLEQELDIDGFAGRAALSWLADPSGPCFDLDREVLAEGWFPPPPAA
ncbi:DUF29 domain-containing protein [Roseicella aquatilis]|nr:DUF29 domain-containing protein [Roseicella aquatilis]